MTTPDAVVGFDGSDAGCTLVVAYRAEDGTWRLEPATRPDPGELVDLVAELAGRQAERRRPLGEAVVDWLAEHAAPGSPPLVLTPEQRELVVGMFERMRREGSAWWYRGVGA